MRARRRLSCLLVPAISLLGAGTTVAAESSEPLEAGYEERVSVTASRTPIPIGESGNSITIISREEIEDRGAPFVADLLRGLPGLSVSRSGPWGAQTQVRVRGAEANHVLVRIDGVDVSDLFGADELPLELMASDSIERIEFVRGPQSGLWGSEAVAGVINLITRPGLESGSAAHVETGSFGSLRAGGRFGLGQETLRFDAGITHADSDGSNIARLGNEDDGARNTTATAGLRWNPENSPLEFDFSARHTESESDFDGIDFVGTGLPFDADNVTGTDLTLLHARVQWASKQSRWSHRLAVSSGGTDVATTLGGTPDTSTEIDKLGASLQSSVDLGRRDSPRLQRLTVAVDHERREFRQRGSATIFGDPNQDQKLDNTGIAVEYRYRPGPRWAATAVIRHEGNSDFDDVTTFRLTGTLRLQDGKSRLRGAIGTGQKAPTFLERFGFFSDTFVGNPDLQPEDTIGFEIGLDRQLGGRAQLALTYFNDTLTHEIDGFFFDAVAGGFTAVNLDGESDRDGLELALDLPLGERLDLRGSYTFTDATEPDGSGGTRSELRRPEHLASLAGHWRSRSNRVEVHAVLNHTGAREDRFFPPFPQPSSVVTLDEYLLADVQLSVEVSRQFEIFARGENLLDEEYEDVFGFRSSGAGGFVGIRFRETDGRRIN